MWIENMPYDEQMLTRFAALLARGAEIYGERNFEKANSREEMGHAKASCSRHLAQWLCGEKDEDHAAAILFNVMMVEYLKWKLSRESKS